MSEQDKTTMSAEEVLQKFDKESDKRNLTGMWDKLISFICIAFAVFQLYTATFGVLDAHLQRAIHLAFGFSLIYLLYPGRKNWSRSVMHPLDVIFAVLSVASALYIVIFYDELVLRAGMNTEFDFSIAFIGTLLLFEAARRVVGWPMLTVALFFYVLCFCRPVYAGDSGTSRSWCAGDVRSSFLYHRRYFWYSTWRIFNIYLSLYLIWFLFGSYGFGQVVYRPG